MQFIQESLKFIQDNLSSFSLCISLFALVATWGNFWNSRRVFLASNYPKIRAELYLSDPQTLPVYDIRNESDKITANELQIKVSIKSWLEFNVLKGGWFIYTNEKLARLRPLESFVPSGLTSNEFCEWLKDRGYEPAPITPLESLEQQKIYSCISEENSYSVRLSVTYTSNIYGANKVCKIYKKYRLVSCPNSQAAEPRDQFYWKLRY